MKLPAVLTIFAVIAFNPLFAEETFTLVFHRIVKPGERFTFAGRAEFEEAKESTVNGAPFRSDKKSATCKMEGELEIVAVHKSGAAREVAIKVTQVDVTENGKPAAPFKPGYKVHLVRGEKRTTAEVEGQVATPLQAKLLDALRFVHSDAATTDDQVFGPDRPVKTGEEWPVHNDVAAADLRSKMLGEFKTENLKGTVRCMGAVRDGDVPCAKVRAELKMSTSGGAVPGMPPEVMMRSMVMAMKGEADLPLDPKKQRPFDTVEMTMSIEGGGTITSDGASRIIEFKVNNRESKEMRLAPMK